MFKEYENCMLCPRKCGINRNKDEKGYCGETSRIMAARAALHFWEEPCISGTKGSGAVFFSGCNMRCVFCQNYDIARGNVQKEISIERLSEIFLELQEQNAENINLVTPTHFVPSIVRALEIAKRNGLNIPVVYNTSAYEEVETLKMMDGLVDIYLPDCKYYDAALSQKYSGAKDYFEKSQSAIEEMLRQVGVCKFIENSENKKIISANEYNDLIMSMEETDEDCDDYNGPKLSKGVIVRHMMLPGNIEDSKNVIKYIHDKFGNDIFISIMNQYTPMKTVSNFPELNMKVDKNDYENLIDYAIDIGIENAFIQGDDTSSESFIPAFDFRGI